MITVPDVHARRRWFLTLLAVTFVASLSAVSAHVVRGLGYPTLATAFVSSPSATQDAPVKLAWGTVDNGLRVVCFATANTSTPRLDEPEWPRITAVGFELPGSPRGFTLVAPREGWELIEGIHAQLQGQGVEVDFALVADRRGHRTRREPGIPPGQDAVRGRGTQFCVSGPFPDTLPNRADPASPVPTTIEQLINGGTRALRARAEARRVR